MDYVTDGTEEVVSTSMTSEECCALCQRRNSVDSSACSVAVLSSQKDKPPRVCWLKGGRVLRSFRKPGVHACWPMQNQALIPPDPEIAAKLDLEKHLSELSQNNYTQPPPLPGDQVPTKEVYAQRREAIRKAVQHAWRGYKDYAWGKDELRPLSGKGIDKKFAHAITMVDSLDTLWIVGLYKEFHEAKEWLARELPLRISRIARGASLFETCIRSLGGLLSAYDLSKEVIFLDLAKQLATKINDKISGSGVAPYTFGGGVGGARCHSLAESGTLQVELRYLAHVTGERSWREKADRFYETLRQKPSVHGLWPNCWDKAAAVGKLNLGADGDSFYEYLVKAWLQEGQKDEHLWKMYDDAVTGMELHLIRKGSDGLTFVGQGKWHRQTDEVEHVQEMEHLTCFIPGWLALGAATAKGAATKEHRMNLAASVAYTCWQMYERQPTGIGPERVKNMAIDLRTTDTREYILRPEALEGWWYMAYYTKDPRYREWGWKTFQNFETWLRVDKGYASLKDVSKTSKVYIDRMESFWVAETLKYAYLLQDPDSNITLDRYIMNTEAHPLTMLQYAAKA